MYLAYGFTTKIGNYSDLDYIFDLYKASMIKSKEFGYYIKLYGCKTTLNNLSEYADEIVDVSDGDFIITDDLKIYIHTQEDLDCCFIDGDLILNSKIDIPTDYDIITDRRGWINKDKSNRFLTNINLFKNYDLSDIQYCNLSHPNSFTMGILKFNSSELKDICINQYYKFRNFYIDNIYPSESKSIKDDPSIIICEQLFSHISDSLNFKSIFLVDYVDYNHYFSISKFYESTKSHVKGILNKDKHLI